MTGLDKSFKDVKDFHKAFNHPAPEKPTPQGIVRASNRSKWVKEECDELIEATKLEDDVERIVGQADAYIDIIYFAVGGLVELGIKPEALWNIVQTANMAKLHDGKAVYHPDGKIKKPDGWVAPEPLLKAEVIRQLKETV